MQYDCKILWMSWADEHSSWKSRADFVFIKATSLFPRRVSWNTAPVPNSKKLPRRSIKARLDPQRFGMVWVLGSGAKVSNLFNQILVDQSTNHRRPGRERCVQNDANLFAWSNPCFLLLFFDLCFYDCFERFIIKPLKSVWYMNVVALSDVYALMFHWYFT